MRFAIVLLTGLAVVALGVLMLTAGVEPVQTVAATPDASGRADGSSARVEELEAELGRLRSDQRAPADDLSAEVERLRAEVARLQVELAEARAALEAPTDDFATPEELTEAIDLLHRHSQEAQRMRHLERIELLKQFLERFPHAPEAGDYVLELADSYLTVDPPEGLAVLDHFAGRIDIEPFELDMTYANHFSQGGRFDESREAYVRAMNAAETTVTKRADAWFWHAYTYYKEGDWAGGRTAFQEVIDRWEGNAMARGTVQASARYLAECEKNLE